MTDEPDDASDEAVDRPDETGDETAPVADDRDREIAAVLAVPALGAETRRALLDAALGREPVAGEGVAGAGVAGGGLAAVAPEGGDDRPDDAGETDPDAGLPERRSGRVAAALGLAAALVIGAIVGVAIVQHPDDQGPYQAAAPTTALDRRAASTSPGGVADQEAAESPAASAAPVVDLGDLGTVADPAAIRAAVNGRLQAGTSATPPTVPCLQSSTNAAAGIYGLVVISAAGTAELDGSTVVVLVGPTTQGDNVAVVLDASRGCAFVRNVQL